MGHGSLSIAAKSGHSSHHHVLVQSFSATASHAGNRRGGAVRLKPHGGEKADGALILLDMV
jgi:hypothetical protein